MIKIGELRGVGSLDHLLKKGHIEIKDDGHRVTEVISHFDAKPLDKIKREVSRKASLANKRLVRLETNELTSLPAYQQWVQHDGGVKFSVAGKDYNQLQSELARVNNFINSKTSLVRQANSYLKEVANITGISYTSVKELPAKTRSFFELASQVEQYLRNVEGSASAIGYHKIWNVINEYVESEKVDLEASRDDMQEALKDIIGLSKYDVKDGKISFQATGWTSV